MSIFTKMTWASVFAVASLGFTAGFAGAQELAREVKSLGKSEVTLLAYDFLTQEELATLRLVSTNEQALAIFVPEQSGYAALAVSPGEGFIREGKPVASAMAIAAMPDQAAADAEAIAQCQAKAKLRMACVVILQVAPKS